MVQNYIKMVRKRIYECNLKYYRKASPEQTKFLLGEIRRTFPEFDLMKHNHLDNEKSEDISQIFTEDYCIEFLKGKGYLIYKQV
jgi:hypothetical protein